jgi:hypothetical protein
MNKFYVSLLLTAFCIACNRNAENKEFKPKSAVQVQTELEAFVENYKWQNTGNKKHPLIAVTPKELSLLKAAWAATGAEHLVLENRFKRVDQAVASPLRFPPEGGQHNQWYQCTSCQMGLVTIDSTHHKCPKCGKDRKSVV